MGFFKCCCWDNSWLNTNWFVECRGRGTQYTQYPITSLRREIVIICRIPVLEDQLRCPICWQKTLFCVSTNKQSKWSNFDHVSQHMRGTSHPLVTCPAPPIISQCFLKSCQFGRISRSSGTLSTGLWNPAGGGRILGRFLCRNLVLLEVAAAIT